MRHHFEDRFGRPVGGRTARCLALMALALAALLLLPGPAEAQTSYVDLDQFEKADQFNAGAKSRVTVGRLSNGDGRVRLARGATSGSLTSPAYRTSTRFDTLVPSWSASTPSGSYIRKEVRIRSGGQWSRWFNLGVWASGTKDVKRRSVNGQSWGKWAVYTDTVQSSGPVFADAYQYRVTLVRKSASGASPTIRKISSVASDSYRHGDDLGVPALKSAWGKNLAVPARSQMVYPNGGEIWCSPTSLSMVMAYWASRTNNSRLNQSVPTVANGTYDYTFRQWGNWPFNTAYASAFGLEGTVTRFSSIEQAERWTDMGIPVIASIAWNNNYSGQKLTNAPLRASNGHLVVVRGFTKAGNPIVNDPAAGSNSAVPRVYNRAEFERAWMRNPYSSGGVVYLVHPHNWKTPYAYASKGSW